MTDALGRTEATTIEADRRSPAVLRAGLLSMLALVALGGTRLIHTSIVGRATDTATYATVATLIGVATTAGLFLPGGLASAASKFIPYLRGAGNPAEANRVYRILTLVGYGTAAVLGPLVALVTWLVLDLSATDAVGVGLLTAAFSLYSVEKGALYGFDRVAPYVRLELVGSGLAIVATVLLVAAGGTAYLAPLTLGYAVLVVGSWWLLRRTGATSTGAATVDRDEVVGYVALASVGGLASAGLLQLLPFLANWFTTVQEVSYFGAAVALVAPLYFLPRALGMALFPRMAHAHGSGDRDTVRRHLDVSTRALLVVLAPLFAAALPMARDVLVLFLGRSFAGGAAVLQVLLVATYLAVIQVAAVNALSSGSRRDVRVPVFSAVAGLVVGLVAMIPLGHVYGAAGVGTAYLLAVVVQAAGPMAVAWRKHEMAWTWPLVRCLVVVFGALAVVRLIEPTPRPGAVGVMIDIVIALMVFIVAAAVLLRDLLAILALVRSPTPVDQGRMPAS